MDISNTNLGQNIPPKKSTQPSEDNVDDPASPPVQPRKKGKFGSRKRLPESDNSSDDDEIPSSVQPQKKIWLGSEDTQTRKKKNKPFSHKKKASDDSDIEIVKDLPETPEKKLGMFN